MPAWIDMKYGNPPTVIGEFRPDWTEYMHYMYLPVRIAHGHMAVPERLDFIWPMLIKAKEFAASDEHIYVTARRGFATPGNPLNRPGWHTDGFGTRDLNLIWTDNYPTEFAVQKFEYISTDHVKSIEQFHEQVDPTSVVTYPTHDILLLDSSVVHAAPNIPPPGGERGFIKVSISKQIYNLKGNSHNYLLDYEWKMWDRSEVRNHPSYAGGDAGPQN